MISMQKNIRLLALFNFFTDFHLYSAILIIYFVQVVESYALAMSIFSVAMVSSAVFELPTGIFSDYIGRKKTMILGAICSVLSVALYAVGTNYWVLVMGALFEGLRRAFYSGNNDALLYESLTETRQKHQYEIYLGKTSSLFQVAATVGIVIGGFIATLSFPLVMWLSVIPQLVCLGISFRIVEPKRRRADNGNIYAHVGEAVGKMLNNRKLRLLSLHHVIAYAVGESTYQFRAAFVNLFWPLWAISFSKVLSSIGATLSYWYSGHIIKKVGALRILLIATTYGKVANIGAVLIANIFSPVLLATTSLFHGVSTVAKSKLMQDEFTDAQRSTLGSLNSLLGNLAFGIFAAVLGVWADAYGPTKALLYAYILSIPSMYIIWYLFTQRNR